MKAFLKAKLEELKTNSKIKNIWELYSGISDFKKGYQPRTNMVEDEKGDLVTDCHCILARWRNQSLSAIEYYVVNSIQFILCLSDPKGGYDPQDIGHVNSITPSVYIAICTEQAIK
jgi:hypothetical protein